MIQRSPGPRLALALLTTLAAALPSCDSSPSAPKEAALPRDADDVAQLEAAEQARLRAAAQDEARRSGELSDERASALQVSGPTLAIPGGAATVGGRSEFTARQVELSLYGFQLFPDQEPNTYGPPHAADVDVKEPTAPAPAGKSFDGAVPDGPSAAAVTAAPTYQFSLGTVSDPINIGGHPSDANVSVGYSHVCVTARAALACYTKGGRIVLAPTTADAFFGGFGFTGLFDLRTGYDHFRNRFWIVGLTNWGSAATQDKLVIAVSRTSDPRDGWYQYWTNAYGGVSATGNNADYPLLGFDSTAVYISNTVDYPSGGGTARYSHLVLFNANDMAAGKPMSQVNGWRFWNLTNPAGGIISSLITPVNNHTATTRGFFLNRRGSNTVDIYALNNPLTTSQSWTVRSVNLASFGSPNTGPQLLDTLAGTAWPIKFDNVGTQALNAHYRSGHLVFTTNDERNWDGQGDRPSVRMVELNVANLDAIQVEIDRTFGARAAGETDYFAYGWAGIGINASSEIGLAYVRTGATIFPQLRVSSWLPGDPDLRSSALATNGFATFQPSNGAGNQVWYDQANASIDPVDNDGIYFAQQYPTTIFGNVKNNFRMLVIKMFGQVRPDVLPTQITASASSVTHGGSFSVTVTIANDGDAVMPAFTGEVRLSSNNYFSVADVLCNSFSRPSLSHLSTPTAVTLTCTTPATIAPGTYYVGALLDTGGAALETHEGNNANPTFVTFPTIQVL